MGDLRNILLIALWLGAKGLLFGQAQQQGGVANRPLAISRRVVAPPQQQQQQAQTQNQTQGGSSGTQQLQQGTVQQLQGQQQTGAMQQMGMQMQGGVPTPPPFTRPTSGPWGLLRLPSGARVSSRVTRRYRNWRNPKVPLYHMQQMSQQAAQGGGQQGGGQQVGVQQGGGQQGGGQQQGGGGQQGGPGASWIGTGTNCTIPVGGWLWGMFDLGYQGGLAGAGGQVVVVSRSPNVSQITWGPPGSTNTNPPVLPGTAGQSAFFNVELRPTSTGAGQEPWNIVLRVGTQTATLSGTITVTASILPPPPPGQLGNQQWPPPLGVPLNGWNHTNVVTLHMGFNKPTGTVRPVKQGVYGPAGFKKFGSLNPRMRLRLP